VVCTAQHSTRHLWAEFRKIRNRIIVNRIENRRNKYEEERFVTYQATYTLAGPPLNCGGGKFEGDVGVGREKVDYCRIFFGMSHERSAKCGCAVDNKLERH
jgi:hypothetical protein